jgi:cytoskeleton protein RodZ
MMTVGEQLKRAREARKWTPQAASKATKIKLDQLLDLEKDDYSAFASPAYARGFVRLYARTLGLEERKILAQLDGRLEEYEEPSGYVVAPTVEYVPEGVATRPEMGPRRLGSLIVYLLLILIVGIIGIQIYRVASRLGGGKSAENAVAPAEPAIPGKTEEVPKATAVSELPPEAKTEEPVKKVEPVAPPKAEPVKRPEVRAALPVEPEVRKAEPASAQQHVLVVEASEDCWVRVMAVEGDDLKELFADLLAAGERKEFRAGRFSLTVAVPAALKISFDGEDYGTYIRDRTPAEFMIPAQ